LRDEGTEKPVAIIELKNRVHPDEDAMDKRVSVRSEVTSAISTSHGFSIADPIVVLPGSTPMATSGEVRRGACVDPYRRTSSPAWTFRYHHEY
jgi:long-chain fatty acid adenylyltransferase FadD28